jgi:hypothetical protein
MSQRHAKRARNAVIATTNGLPACACPYCGARLDAVTGATIDSPGGEDLPPRPVPKPGSVTLCWHCAGVLVFDSQMRIRRADPGLEARILKEWPAVAQLQQWIKERGEQP